MLRSEIVNQRKLAREVLIGILNRRDCAVLVLPYCVLLNKVDCSGSKFGTIKFLKNLNLFYEKVLHIIKECFHGEDVSNNELVIASSTKNLISSCFIFLSCLDLPPYLPILIANGLLDKYSMVDALKLTKAYLFNDIESFYLPEITKHGFLGHLGFPIHTTPHSARHPTPIYKNLVDNMNNFTSYDYSNYLDTETSINDLISMQCRYNSIETFVNKFDIINVLHGSIVKIFENFEQVIIEEDRVLLMSGSLILEIFTYLINQSITNVAENQIYEMLIKPYWNKCTLVLSSYKSLKPDDNNLKLKLCNNLWGIFVELIKKDRNKAEWMWANGLDNIMKTFVFHIHKNKNESENISLDFMIEVSLSNYYFDVYKWLILHDVGIRDLLINKHDTFKKEGLLMNHPLDCFVSTVLSPLLKDNDLNMQAYTFKEKMSIYTIIEEVSLSLSRSLETLSALYEASYESQNISDRQLFPDNVSQHLLRSVKTVIEFVNCLCKADKNLEHGLFTLDEFYNRNISENSSIYRIFEKTKFINLLSTILGSNDSNFYLKDSLRVRNKSIFVTLRSKYQYFSSKFDYSCLNNLIKTLHACDIKSKDLGMFQKLKLLAEMYSIDLWILNEFSTSIIRFISSFITYAEVYDLKFNFTFYDDLLNYSINTIEDNEEFPIEKVSLIDGSLSIQFRRLNSILNINCLSIISSIYANTNPSYHPNKLVHLILCVIPKLDHVFILNIYKFLKTSLGLLTNLDNNSLSLFTNSLLFVQPKVDDEEKFQYLIEDFEKLVESEDYVYLKSEIKNVEINRDLIENPYHLNYLLLEIVYDNIPVVSFWPYFLVLKLPIDKLIYWLECLLSSADNLKSISTGDKFICIIALCIIVSNKMEEIEDEVYREEFIEKISTLLFSLTTNYFDSEIDLNHFSKSCFTMSAYLCRLLKLYADHTVKKTTPDHHFLILCDQFIDLSLYQVFSHEIHSCLMAILLTPVFSLKLREKIWFQFGTQGLLHLLESPFLCKYFSVLITKREKSIMVLKNMVEALKLLKNVEDQNWIITTVAIYHITSYLITDTHENSIKFSDKKIENLNLEESSWIFNKVVEYSTLIPKIDLILSYRINFVEKSKLILSNLNF